MEITTQLLGVERIFYASAFGIGLLVTVYAMLHGSVRMGNDPSAVKAPHAALNRPVFGASCLAFGAVGYLFEKYSQLDTISVIAIALIIAAAGWVGMTVLMARWALQGPIIDPHEELEELQGTVAMVTQDITLASPGKISYSFRGKPLHVAARSITGDAVPAGTEVVIERIEDGLADVELWSVVEARL